MELAARLFAMQVSDDVYIGNLLQLSITLYAIEAFESNTLDIPIKACIGHKIGQRR